MSLPYLKRLLEIRRLVNHFPAHKKTIYVLKTECHPFFSTLICFFCGCSPPVFTGEAQIPSSSGCMDPWHPRLLHARVGAATRGVIPPHDSTAHASEQEHPAALAKLRKERKKPATWANVLLQISVF